MEAEEYGLDSAPSLPAAPPAVAPVAAAKSAASAENGTVAKPFVEKEGSGTLASSGIQSPAAGMKPVNSQSHTLQFVPAVSLTLGPSPPCPKASSAKIENVEQVRSVAGDVNISETSPSSVFKPLSPELCVPSAGDRKSLGRPFRGRGRE